MDWDRSPGAMKKASMCGTCRISSRLRSASASSSIAITIVSSLACCVKLPFTPREARPPAKPRWPIGANSAERRHVHQLGRPYHVLDVLPAHGPVLAIDEHRVEPHVPQELHQPRRAVTRCNHRDRLAA